MFDFAYPWMLLLYLPFLGLIFYAIGRPKPSIKVSNVKPFKTDRTKGFNTTSIPFLLYSVAIGLLIFALARPRKGVEHIIHRAEGVDIMIAIDLSGSMKAYDVPEEIGTERQLIDAIQNKTIKNRLETAKDEIRKFIKKRPNDRIGLVAFAPLPYVSCPPTLDHAFLFQHLDDLKPGMIGDQTGIAGPIASAVHRLKDAESKRRVVVLFTDGKNNVNAKVSPRQAAKLAETFNVTVYTVGIGSGRAYIMQQTPFGNQIVPFPSEFDEELLFDLAEISKGKYYAAKDAEGLEKAMNEIDKLEKTVTKQPHYIDYSEWAPRIITASILILLVGFFLEHTLFLRLP